MPLSSQPNTGSKGGAVELLAIIAAPIITGLVTLLGIILTNRKTAAVKEAKDEMRAKERQEWESRVEAKLDEHNSYGKKFGEVAEKFGDLSVTLARIDERLKALEH